jgi:hypothetical protein
MPNSSGPMKTMSADASVALARLFFVFLSAPSETATISPCQLGRPPIWGFAAAEARGIYAKEI